MRFQYSMLPFRSIGRTLDSESGYGSSNLSEATKLIQGINTVKFKSKIFEAIYESASDLHSAGMIDDATMEDFNKSCLVHNKYSAESLVFDHPDTREFATDKDAINFYTRMYASDFVIYCKGKMIYCNRLNFKGKITPN
jgi:hypothetical protein